MNTNSTQDSNIHLIQGVVSVYMALGLPSNSYIVWLMLTGASGTMTSDIFSFNLAVAEILFCLSHIWFFINAYIPSAFALGSYMFSAGLVFTARPLFQCCICIEHYIGVVHPVLFLRWKLLRYRLTCCCVIWIFVLVSCISSLFGYRNVSFLYGYFIQNGLLFFVTLFCCLSVLRALKRPTPGNKERKRGNSMKRRAFKIISLIMIFMIFNYCLYVIPIPMQCCLKDLEFGNAISISLLLVLYIGLVEPLLYLYRARKLTCMQNF